MTDRQTDRQTETQTDRQCFGGRFEVYDNLHHLTYGLINATSDFRQRAQSVDRHFVREITNHLFQPSDKPFGGLDLVALNIQRGMRIRVWIIG